jgi:hypothetical protein
LAVRYFSSNQSRTSPRWCRQRRFSGVGPGINNIIMDPERIELLRCPQQWRNGPTAQWPDGPTARRCNGAIAQLRNGVGRISAA